MAETDKKNRELSVFQAILARRSVRTYEPRVLDITTVQTLLEAAVRAPTAMHEEPWSFVVVQDKPALKRLSDDAKPLFIERLLHAESPSPRVVKTFNHPDFNIFHDAGTLIIIGTKMSGSFVEADCWLAAENLMLAACAMGLGSCVVGSSLSALNTPGLKAALGIPTEFKAIAPVVVGVPRGKSAATSRKKPQVLSWMFPNVGVRDVQAS